MKRHEFKSPKLITGQGNTSVAQVEFQIVCSHMQLLIGFSDFHESIRLYVKSQDPFKNVLRIEALKFRLGSKFIQERNQRF